jgi:uncharacterized repeat protein (TIGR03803 family)
VHGSPHNAAVPGLEVSRGDVFQHQLVHPFTGNNAPSAGPNSSLAMDSAENLYGTTFQDGAYFRGSVFKLTQNGGQWIFSTLHDFQPIQEDGATPTAGVVVDANNVVYGATIYGGQPNVGVIYKITQDGR